VRKEEDLRPVDGEVVWVLAGRASLLELLGGGEVFGDDVGSVKGVHVRDVLSGEDEGVYVFSTRIVLNSISSGQIIVKHT
jgi:hypothetical protein